MLAAAADGRLAGAIGSGGGLQVLHKAADVFPTAPPRLGAISHLQLIGTNVQLHLQPDWHLTLGQYVEVQRNGRTTRTGVVEEVMPDGSILWLAAAGVDSREMVERADGSRIYATYPQHDPPFEEVWDLRDPAR